jgi:Protein of unknown function (DUF2730)
MEIKDWVAMAALIFTVVNTLSIYLINASKVTKGHVESHEGRLTKMEGRVAHVDSHEGRIAKLESDVAALPSKDAFHRLELDVSEVKGTTRVLETELKPISSGLMRIEKYLLEHTLPRTRTK